MNYEIRITENAKQDYVSLDARWRSAVKRALEAHLRRQPQKKSRSRIKRLKGIRKPQYRLRVEALRVFYDVAENYVTVHAIVPKEKANDWLELHGEKDHD